MAARTSPAYHGCPNPAKISPAFNGGQGLAFQRRNPPGIVGGCAEWKLAAARLSPNHAFYGAMLIMLSTLLQLGKRLLISLALIGTMAVSGCILPLPGTQVPAARSRWKIDPRQLVATGGPVNPTEAREKVHAAIGVPRDYFGFKAPPEVETYYFYTRAGSFFFLGPNPEGGLVGFNKRFICYTLKIAYDANDLFKARELTSFEVLDSHKAAKGKYE